MNAIFKKSILTSLCAVSLLVSTLPASGMLMIIDWVVEKCFTQKKIMLAPTEAQKFAHQCYAAMDQFKDDYSYVPRTEIDEYVTKHNSIEIYIGKISQKSHKKTITNAQNNGHRILIDKTFWEQNAGPSNTLTPYLKQIICHEVAHAWLGHSLRKLDFEKRKKEQTIPKLEYLNLLELLSKRQMEFEAQTVTMRALYTMNEHEAIAANYWETPFIAGCDNDAYILGFLNGISQIKDEDFKTKTYALFTDKYNESVKQCENNTLEKNEGCTKIMRNLNFIRQLGSVWKPVRLSSEAQDLACAILKNNKQKALKT